MESIKQVADPIAVFLLAIRGEVSDKTLRGYLSDLNKFELYFERQYNCPFDPRAVDKQDVVSFIRWLQRDIGHHNNTVRRIHCCLRSAFYEWFLRGMCFDNPAKEVKLVPAVKSVRMYLEAEEVNRLIAAIDDPTIKMATQIMAYAGLRIDECVRLRMMDVHLDQKILHVAYGKGRQARDVPIYPTLYKALKRYWVKRNVQVQGEHRLLATKTGQLSQSYYTKRLHEVTDRLGWSREITAHVLRHSFATDLVVRNFHIAVIQDLLGHNDLRATQVYVHAPMHLKRRAVNSLYSEDGADNGGENRPRMGNLTTEGWKIAGYNSEAIRDSEKELGSGDASCATHEICLGPRSRILCSGSAEAGKSCGQGLTSE